MDSLQRIVCSVAAAFYVWHKKFKGGDFVSKEQFKAERLYLVSLFVAKSIFREGIISEEEYEEIDTILLEKYRPVLGT